MGRIFVPTSETLPAAADAVVIGGGIVGVASAFWLARAGLDTVLLETRGELASLTSCQSIESFRAQFSEPAMAELALASIGMLDCFADVVGIPGYDIEVRHQGYLFVTDDPAQLPALQAAVAAHHSLGVPDSEYLDAAELHARFPYLSERAAGATFRQNDGWFSSHAATQGFAKGCDARFLLNTPAAAIVLDGRGVCGVSTALGTIATRVAVNSAGPFAGEVGRMAGVELPVQPMRRQKAFVTPKPQIPQDAPLVIDVVRDAYWRPETGGAYIAWVDPDDPVRAPTHNVPTEWDFPAVTLEKLEPLTPFWGEIAAHLKHDDLRMSAGQYVYTPDDQPLIGPWPEVPGFFLNCGYWAGVMMSPGAGKRLADLVVGACSPQANPLRPTRFAEGVIQTGASFLRGHH